MKKYKFFADFEKEEQWLDEMGRRGYAFIAKRSLAYEFRPAKPEETRIKIDYRMFRNQSDFEDYLALFEDSGWRHIAGTKRSGHQYFKKADEKAGEDIFSDAASRAGRYKRLSDMWIALAFTFLPIFAALISTGAIDAAALLNPRLLYYTPGLWDKTGTDFWRAFLFETPFALFRGLGWLLLPILIVLYLIFAIKANRHYRESQEDGRR